MNGSTDWLSAIGVLLAGLVLGFMFIYAYSRKRGGASATTPATDPELAELEAKRDSLVRELREIEDTGDGVERKKLLEAETATVLRSIDERLSRGGTPAERPSGPSDEIRKAHITGFVWGASSMAALALLGFFVQQSSKPREDAPGSAMAPATAVPGTPQVDSVLAELEAAVAREPQNADRRIDLARAYLDRENMMGVFEQTKAVLDRNPNDPRALTYNAIVRMAMGQVSEAKAQLTSATGGDPKLVDAWVGLAWIGVQEGDLTAARKAIDSAIRHTPENEPRLREVWAQMQQRQGSAESGGSQQSGATGGAPGPGIQLTISLADPSRAKGGVVYVIARAAGQTAGPPIAVKRIDAPSFPLSVQLTAADSMMGQALPGQVSIEARLDADGDASTKNPSDLRAVADGIALGGTASLTLR